MKRHARKQSHAINARMRSAPGQHGAQLLELALVLPILLFLVVGAWDFGSKIVLRQKLTNAAREGARVMVSSSLRNSTNCTTTNPCAVVSAANMVKLYLTNAGLDASWISGDSPSNSTACSWTYNQSTAGGASVVFNAAYPITTSTGAPALATQVTITWPIKWQLGGLLGGYAPSYIQTSAVMADIVGVC